jgi:ABC-type bacteriocin/lantibiotic exporter with double-glycine peptidase domain
VACLPVITAVLAVVAMLVIPGAYTAAAIGTLVAILPRSLQLFGNIHSLTMYLSQYYLIRRKVRNLDEFIETLDKNDFSTKVSYSSLRIINAMTGDTESPEEFERLVLNGGISSGRFCITGPNGAGKSSMLKTFKSQSHDSTLLLPDVNLGVAQENRSTGESRVHQVMLALESESSIVMLDEWDANLDSRNRKTLNSVIDEFAKIKLIIEVKHVSFEGITV